MPRGRPPVSRAVEPGAAVAPARRRPRAPLAPQRRRPPIGAPVRSSASTRPPRRSLALPAARRARVAEALPLRPFRS
eukprot:9065055-Alexandrium_andersonii.AAC.1